MPKIKVEEVIITSRARMELGDDYEQLKESIDKRGLIHPILVNKKDMTLVAGFRRLSCHIDLNLGIIECKFKEDLTGMEKKLYELEENIHKELTWDEKAKLRTEIHNLYQKIHGEAVKGHKSEGWGVEKSAELLNVSAATISQDTALVHAMEILPGLKDMASRRQALKVLDKVNETAILTELARREAEKDQMVSIPYLLYHGDAIDIVSKRIDNDTIDLVIFDPPWGIDVHRIASSRGPRGEKTSYKDDTEESAIKLTMNLLPELHRVMKEDAHLYMFIGMQYKDFYIDLLSGFQKSIEMCEIMAVNFPNLSLHYDNLLAKIQAHVETLTWKFHVEEIPLIWVKEGGGFTDFENKFMPRYETILFCSRERVRPLNEPTSNVFNINRPLTTERYHTQEKPIELIERLIKVSTQPNQIVLDPCAGSFVTTVAATLSGRRSIAIDNNKEAYEKGLARISGLMAEDGEEGEESEE